MDSLRNKYVRKLNVMNLRAVTLHIFCSNASIFVDFGLTKKEIQKRA